MKIAILTGIAMLTFTVQAFSSTDILYRAASDYSLLTAPMIQQNTSSSPTGSRVYTTALNSGSVKYALELEAESDFEIEVLVFADSTWRNTFGLSVGGSASTSWELPVDTTYQWRKFPGVFHAVAGTVEVILNGAETYTRLAAVRMTKIETTPLEVSVGGPTTLEEGIPGVVVLTKTAGSFGTIPYQVKKISETQGESISTGSVTFAFTDTSKSISLLIPEDTTYDDARLEVTVGESAPLIIPVVDNDGDSAETVNSIVNTNYTNFVSPIDGAATITNTVTITPVSGSLVTPLKNALLAATPGTRIIIPNGTYTNQSFNFSSSNCASGTSQSPIIIQAATPGGVVLTGSSGFRLCGSYVVVQGLVFSGVSSTSPFKVGDSFSGTFMPCNFCALRNIKIDGYSPASPDTTTTWIQILSDANFVSSSNVEISDSYFNNKTNLGVILYARPTANGAKHRIYRNYFSRPLPSGTITNGLEAIRMGDSDSSTLSGATVIEHNLFYRANGDAEAVSIKSNDNVVRFNTFVETKGALSVRIGHRNIIEGNYILGNSIYGTGGIRINGTDNLILGNHLQDLRVGASSYLSTIALLNGETGTCTSAAYCPVVNPFVVSNFLSRNDTNIVFGAAPKTERTVFPENVVTSRNIVDTTTMTSKAFVNENSSLDSSFSSNRILGTIGLTLTSAEAEQLQSLPLATMTNIRFPEAKKAHYDLRLFSSRLTALGLAESLKSRVAMGNKTIYEVSPPLTSNDVGLYAGPYSN